MRQKYLCENFIVKDGRGLMFKGSFFSKGGGGLILGGYGTTRIQIACEQLSCACACNHGNISCACTFQNKMAYHRQLIKISVKCIRQMFQRLCSRSQKTNMLTISALKWSLFSYIKIMMKGQKKKKKRKEIDNLRFFLHIWFDS